jgi:hypothetical protein
MQATRTDPSGLTGRGCRPAKVPPVEVAGGGSGLRAWRSGRRNRDGGCKERVGGRRGARPGELGRPRPHWRHFFGYSKQCTEAAERTGGFGRMLHLAQLLSFPTTTTTTGAALREPRHGQQPAARPRTHTAPRAAVQVQAPVVLSTVPGRRGRTRGHSAHLPPAPTRVPSHHPAPRTPKVAVNPSSLLLLLASPRRPLPPTCPHAGLPGRPPKTNQSSPMSVGFQQRGSPQSSKWALRGRSPPPGLRGRPARLTVSSLRSRLSNPPPGRVRRLAHSC